jgi:hypothetical protein
MQRAAELVCLVSLLASCIREVYLREILLIKFVFILSAATACNRPISTMMEFVKEEIYAISDSAVNTGTAN